MRIYQWVTGRPDRAAIILEIVSKGTTEWWHARDLKTLAGLNGAQMGGIMGRLAQEGLVESSYKDTGTGRRCNSKSWRYTGNRFGDMERIRMIAKQTEHGFEEMEPRCTVWSKGTEDRCREECDRIGEKAWPEMRGNLADHGVCIMEGEE